MFKVIEDLTQLRALGEAGLLWHIIGAASPSTLTPKQWRNLPDNTLQVWMDAGLYAILIEE